MDDGIDNGNDKGSNLPDRQQFASFKLPGKVIEEGTKPKQNAKQDAKLLGVGEDSAAGIEAHIVIFLPAFLDSNQLGLRNGSGNGPRNWQMGLLRSSTM